jgi:hypothetical protein
VDSREYDVLRQTDVELLKCSCDSIARLARDFSIAGRALDSKATSRSLRNLTAPQSRKGAVRKLGVALAVAPEPVTTVAGIALIAVSFTIGGKEPASTRTLHTHAENQFSELDSFGLQFRALSVSLM